MTSDAAAITTVAALGDDLRRNMYDFIRRSGRPVTRDEAAASVGISRKLAAFHLDKLVAAGLLTADYANPPGVRRVGRAPKVYEPSDVDVHVSIPQREHGILADILIDAVLSETDDENARQAALRVATDRGRALGEAERDRTRPGRLGTERALTRAGEILGRHGFEPTRATPALLRLRNCPFHPLAAKAPDLVCAINHAFLAGLLTGLDADTVHATLAPRPGACCVELGT
ncbi:helix-turn-helix domain-containing protein [Actinoallomurus bryophytorum]|uniref:Putative ArsR family transcriptional regulator n=1 Tax=Actinoallomurus bryophytorum TaxID=1490222 RepID=A0A543BTG2_9ACTN|nr:helix-turn-helix domain-containing protein [Actinoallomurus bryophytorum]TQL88111.1 putative ArsR family transcriptional regulator [Actinoallomurus bryophytorum]